MSAQEEYEKIKAKIEQQVKYGLPAETPSAIPSETPESPETPEAPKTKDGWTKQGDIEYKIIGTGKAKDGSKLPNVYMIKALDEAAIKRYEESQARLPEAARRPMREDRKYTYYVQLPNDMTIPKKDWDVLRSAGLTGALKEWALTADYTKEELADKISRVRQISMQTSGPSFIGTDMMGSNIWTNTELTPSQFEALPTEIKAGFVAAGGKVPEGAVNPYAGLPEGSIVQTEGTDEGTVGKVNVLVPTGFVSNGEPEYAYFEDWKTLTPEIREEISQIGIQGYQSNINSLVSLMEQYAIKDENGNITGYDLSNIISSDLENNPQLAEAISTLFPDFDITAYETQVKSFLDETGGNFDYWKTLAPEQRDKYLEQSGWQPVKTEAGTQVGYSYDISRGETAEKYAQWKRGEITEQQWMDYIEGVTTKASGIIIPPSPPEIIALIESASDVGGDVAYYNSLQTDDEKNAYYIDIASKKLIKDTGGDLEYYNSLTTRTDRDNYIQQLYNTQLQQFSTFQENVSTIQPYIDNGKISIDKEGRYSFNKLTAWDMEQNPELESALRSVFAKDIDGNDIDIVNMIENIYPTYLNNADEMTPTMKHILYYDGIEGLSLFGLTPREKFDKMQSWGLIPIGAKYISETVNYVPTDAELLEIGLSLNEYLDLIKNSGGDWTSGMPVWSLPDGRLSPETVGYFKTLDWSAIQGKTGQISIPAVQTILTERYGGKDWNDLTEEQRKFVLELYYQPSKFEQLKGGYTEIEEWIAGEPIPEGQIYVGLTAYNAPAPTDGIEKVQYDFTNWTKKEENAGLRFLKGIPTTVINLAAGFYGMGVTAADAARLAVDGNFVQAGKNLVGIPVGMSEFMVYELPKDIIGDPAYGLSEIVGMFLLPEVLKGGYRAVKTSFKAVDPRIATSSVYSTDPNIRFYKGSPYMTAVEFRDAFQGLQEKQRNTPNTRAIFERVITDVPNNVIEPRFTKVGNEYVIDGTKIDNTGNLIEVREPRYHPSANIVDDVGTLRDTAKIILYHVLPDGTKEYLVVKDRAGGAYQLSGGGLEIKAGSALAQVLRELFEETNLKAKGVVELQPYLGKMHSHAYNGTRVFMGEVVDKVAFDRFLHAHEGIPEVKSAVWIKDSGFPKVQVGVMPATYDVLTGVGVPKNALKIVGVDKVTDTARDLTWGERIKADRLPTEAEIKAASLKEPAIIDGQIKTMLIKTLTPANMNRPVRLWHFTHDYADLMSKAQDGVITLTDANKKYNSFYTSPEPASFYSYRNISKGFPVKHRPALLAIDVMPSELIKAGYELEWVRDGATGQYVWKIAHHVIEDEITLAQGAKLKTYTPNWISKTISKGDFKDFTAASLTDNAGVTARINLQPKLVEFTGKLPEIKASNIRKVVIDLDDTLVDVRTMKLMSGAIELLDALKTQGKVLTLWTHSPKVRVQEIFKRNPELKKYFDINNKDSVITREDYTKLADADTFKNIKAIKGDILIDNSPNQIYQQLQRGNVGLQAVDLYSIRNMLTRDDVIQSSRVSKEVPQYTTYKQGQKIPVLYLQTEAYKMATEAISKAVDKLSANKLYIEELNKQILERKKQGLPTEELESEIKRILDADVEAIKYMVDLNKLGIKDIPITVGELYNLKGIAFREKLYDIIGGKIKPKPVKLAWHGSADSPFKNVSTSLKTKVEGLEKYGKKEKGAKEEPYKEKFKEADEYDKASEAYKKEKLKSEEELSGKEPYKIGVGESLGALLVSSGESEIEKYNKELEALNKEEASKIAEYNKEIASIREGVLEEYKSVEEVVTEVSPPEEVMGEGAITEGVMPETGITEGVLPEAKMAEGVALEGTMTEGIIPEGTIPEGIIPEGVIPEGMIPEGTIPETIPPPSLYGVILGSGGKPLTQEQKLGAIGWKQGIMYKYIYPPYGQEDIINSRSPIQGIPMKEGIRSAYETIIRTRPGFIPPNITRHMGMMDIQITDADKNGQPEIKFMEREHRKGRGSVKKQSTAQVFTINT